jgi:hypothetical protein
LIKFVVGDCIFPKSNSSKKAKKLRNTFLMGGALWQIAGFVGRGCLCFIETRYAENAGRTDYRLMDNKASKDKIIAEVMNWFAQREVITKKAI